MDGSNKAPDSPEAENRVIKFNRNTPVARLNYRMLNTLSHALEEDPEVDLLSIFPDFYLSRITRLRQDDKGKRPTQSGFLPRDTRSLFKESDTITIISPLSDEVTELLDQEDNLSGTLIDLLDRSKVLFQYPHGFSTMVLQVSSKLVVKIARDVDNLTEYTSMQYLEQHLPDFPAPKPLGLVRMRKFYLIFLTFMSGLDLEEVWPQLEHTQKQDISRQLEVLVSELRSLPFPEKQPLGGVKGEGCKDARRHIRYSSQPILTIQDFEDFVFSNSSARSTIYVDFLRTFSRLDQSSASCVLTHGDLRPANIKVKQNKDGRWEILGILDWEFSGFYPAYWEGCKITNNLSSIGRSDWYLYIPKSISPFQIPVCWLLDRVWDMNIA